MKKILVIALVLVSAVVNAQGIRQAMKLYDQEQYSKATVMFQSLISQKTDETKAYYFLGMIAFQEENFTKAKELFQSGLALNPKDPLNTAAIGIVADILGNANDAKVQFKMATDLVLLNRKYKDGLSAALTGYTLVSGATKDTANAILLLKKAYELENTNPEVYFYTGMAYLNLLDGGRAISNFESALDFDKQMAKSQWAIGSIYMRAKSYQDAKMYLDKSIETDSTFAPAYRDLGDLYFQMRQTDKSILSYKKYLSLLDKDDKNSYSQIKYASFLLMSREYKMAYDQIKDVLSRDVSNVYSFRILNYSAYELGKYEEGLAASKTFFEKVKKDKIRPADYEYLGKTYMRLAKDSLAEINMDKAVAMDSSYTYLNDTIAVMYKLSKNYTKEASRYDVIMAKDQSLSAQATYSYKKGLALYFGKNYASADSSFARIIEIQPNFISGYLWRARCNYNLDVKETGTSIPFYETFIEKANEEPAKYKKDLVEAYGNAGLFYYKKNDLPKSKLYIEKTLELDPTNDNAQKVLKNINILQKTARKPVGKK